MKKRKKFLETLANLVEEQPNPKTEPEPEENQEEITNLSNKRKRALLNYLTFLFGAACVIVSISLVATWRTNRDEINQLNTSASTALSKIEALQAENTRMGEENQELTTINDQLQQELERVELANQEYIETMQTEAELKANRVKLAYEYLLLAQDAVDIQDRAAFQDAIGRLDALWESLDQAGQRHYRSLLAYNWDSPEQ